VRATPTSTFGNENEKGAFRVYGQLIALVLIFFREIILVNDELKVFFVTNISFKDGT